MPLHLQLGNTRKNYHSASFGCCLLVPSGCLAWFLNVQCSSLERDSLRYFAWFPLLREMRSRTPFRNRTLTENRSVNCRVAASAIASQVHNLLHKLTFVLCTHKFEAATVLIFNCVKIKLHLFLFYIWWPHGLLGVSWIVRGATNTKALRERTLNFKKSTSANLLDAAALSSQYIWPGKLIAYRWL